MDSNKQIFKAFICQKSDSIGLQFGTQLTLRQLSANGSKRVVKLLNGLDDNVFVAQFNVPDVDFELRVDNIFSTKNLCYAINQKRFYLKRGNFAELKALKNYGKQLRFKSQTEESAQTIVKSRAERLNISVEESAIECSRIGVSIHVEKEFIVNGNPLDVIIRLYVIRPNGQQEVELLDITIGDRNTVEELKRLIEALEGIQFKDQTLYSNSKLLLNSLPLSVYNIENNSVLTLIPRVVGGLNVNESALDEMYGRRGIICLGRETNQYIGLKDEGFKADPNVVIEPFVIEFRFESKN